MQPLTNLTTVFGPRSAHLAALDEVLTELEAVEVRIREAEAHRVELLARAHELARSEASAANAQSSSSSPSSSSSSSSSSASSSRESDLALRAVQAEIALCLRLSEQTVQRRLAHAYTLRHDYPLVLAAYRDGQVSERHTSVIIDAGVLIADDDSPEATARRAAYEHSVLEAAIAETPNRLRPIARRLAELYAERSLDERHAVARQTRRVWVEGRDDGMADLCAHVPAVEAYAIKDRLNQIAREIADAERANQVQSRANQVQSRANQVQSRATRSRDEIRADALVDLLLTGETGTVEDIGTDDDAGVGSATGDDASVGSATGDDASVGSATGDDAGAGGTARNDTGLGSATGVRTSTSAEGSKINGAKIRGRVQIVMHEQHLTWVRRGSPPELQGYGPIDTHSARSIAGSAESWDRIFEDASSGMPLSVDRYRPSEQMRRVLRARDQHCRFPGCRAALHQCDLDHTIDAQHGGPTSTSNLAHLCRHHHVLKHHTGWNVSQDDNGNLHWVSPTGREHEDRPRSRVRFAAVSDPGETQARVRR